MAVDFGKPLEAGCRETLPGVYERRYEHRTVKLIVGLGPPVSNRRLRVDTAGSVRGCLPGDKSQ